MDQYSLVELVSDKSFYEIEEFLKEKNDEIVKIEEKIGLSRSVIIKNELMKALVDLLYSKRIDELNEALESDLIKELDNYMKKFRKTSYAQLIIRERIDNLKDDPDLLNIINNVNIDNKLKADIILWNRYISIEQKRDFFIHNIEITQEAILTIENFLGSKEIATILIQIKDKQFMKKCLENENLILDSYAIVSILEEINDIEYIKQYIIEHGNSLDSFKKSELISFIGDIDYTLECIENPEIKLSEISQFILLKQFNDNEKTRKFLKNNKSLEEITRLSVILSSNDIDYIRESLEQEEFENLNSVQALKFATGDTKYFEEKGKKKRLTIPKGLDFGIEIESGGNDFFAIISPRVNNRINNWELVLDGSGTELSSPILTNNEISVNEIYRTCNFLAEMGQNTTEEDGGHIHFSAKYLKDRNAYINLLELYGNTEKLLYLISNEENQIPRLGIMGNADPLSKYIQKQYNETQNLSSEEIEKLSSLDDKTFIKELKNIQQGDREFGINLDNLEDDSGIKQTNTIEFRMPNGTIKPDVWIENINLFGGILKASQELSEIQSKKTEELTEADKNKLKLFEMVKTEGVDDKTKLQYLLELAINEEDREIYMKRYFINEKIFIEENKRLYEALESGVVQTPLRLDLWRPTTYKIGEYCYTSKNPFNEPVSGEGIETAESRLNSDLDKTQSKTK